MICYHHSDGGMSRGEKYRFLSGRNALVSYMYRDEEGIAFEVCSRVVLDNGAYTVWRQGGSLDYDGFLSWVRARVRHPRFAWALIPDAIDGTPEENDALLDRWPRDLKRVGVPVYHLHEPIPRIRLLCKRYYRVAISPAEYRPGSNDFWARMKKVMDACTDAGGYPIAKLHGLKLMDPKISERLPLTSADSMTAVRHANNVKRFGTYPPPTAAARAGVIADRMESHHAAAVWERIGQGSLFSNDDAHRPPDVEPAPA